MPKLKYALPKYRKYKASGNAVVTIGGRDHDLGSYGSEASRSEYDRLMAEWIGRGRPSVEVDRSAPTVSEIALLYVKHAEQYYILAASGGCSLGRWPTSWYRRAFRMRCAR